MAKTSYQLYQQRLIAKRKKLGFSLQTLAERSGVSKSIISKIELAQVQPSIQTASRIAEGLGCSLSDMFQSEQVGEVIFHPVDQQFTFKNDTHTKKIISPTIKSACLEIFHEHLDVGETLEDLINLDADKFILALDHELSVKTESTEHTMSKGDCLYLDSKVTHSIKNLSQFQVSFITTIHRKNHP
ncbi:MAG: hypothetical protein COA95_05640 [Methylophaga sp.]|nr:MAG: hypothetical protein COA95_05640 [Methylophaga sp.]